MRPFEHLIEILGLSDQTSAYTTGVLIAIVLLVLGRLLLPKGQRRSLRLPFAAFVVHVALMAIRQLLTEDTRIHSWMGLAALFLLLISIGRTGVLVTIHSMVNRGATRPLPKIFTDIIQGTIYAAALFVTLSAAGVAMDSLLTTSALLTAVVGLSLQDTLGNLFAGLAIQVQRPFEVGDWIQFDDKESNTGMVVEINWRAAKVLTLDQIEVIVPNNQLARAPIRNFTKPMIEARRTVFAYAPYRVPPRRVERLILRAIKDVPGVLDDPAPSVIPYDFSDRGVQYQVRYFIREFLERETIDAAVRERAWYALHREGIDIPVPQRFIELHEGTKEEAREEQERHVTERMAYLRRVQFLSGLPDDALRALAEGSETRLYDAGEAVIRQGDADSELYIVVRGAVTVHVQHANKRSREIEVARLDAGEFFGEMSLMTGEKRKATVRSVGECELMALGKEAFHRVFDVQPELMQRLSVELAEREKELDKVANTDRKSEVDTSHERSAELLKRIRDFFSL